MTTPQARLKKESSMGKLLSAMTASGKWNDVNLGHIFRSCKALLALLDVESV